MSQRWANLSLMVVLSNCCFNVVATGNFKRFFNSSDSISPSTPSILPQPLVLGITGQSTGFPSTSTPPSSAKETKSLLPTSSHLKSDSVNVTSPLTSIFIPTSLPLSSITSPATFSSSSSTASTSFGVSAPDSDDGYVIFTPPTFNKPAPTNNETRPCITPNPSVGNTVFIIMPNTTTITLGSNTTYSPIPEFTPPVYCQNQTINISSILTTSSYYAGSPKIYTGQTPPKETEPQTISPVPLYSSGPHNTYLVPPTTVIITSKNPVVVYTSNTPPSYPSTPKTAYISKVPVDPQGILSQQKAPPSFPVSPTKDSPHITMPTSSDTNPAQPNNGGGNGDTSPGVQSQPGGNFGELGGSDGSPGGSDTTTAVISDVTVILAPSRVVINEQTIGGVSRGSQPTVVTQKDQVFTVLPSQVVGPGTFLAIPSAGAGSTGSGNGNSDSESSGNGGSFGGGGASFVVAPSSAVIGRVTVEVGQSIAVVNGASYTIGPGAPDKTTVVNQQTVSIGAGGLAFSGTTLVPLPPEPTNILVLGGQPITVENSVAYIGPSTFTYGVGSATKTDIFNGETILIGPSGVSLAKTTLAAGPGLGPQLGIAGGLTLTEVGATLGVVSGTTFTVGPGATSTVAVINGETISAGPSAIIGAGTTLAYPLINPTHAVTVEGITFTEIGPTLAVLDGTTFTFGPGAQPTSHTFNGQTISIGPQGIGFATTTFTGATNTKSSSPPSTSASETGQGEDNGVGIMTPAFGILGACFLIGAGFIL